MRDGSLAAVTAESGGRDVSARFHALEARVAQLEQAEAARKRARLRPGDVDTLTRVLPVLGGALGSRWFTLSELRTHRAVALQLVLDGWSSKRLGKLFARATGELIGGFALERAGETHGSACWRVVGHVGDFESPETPRASSAAIRCLSSSDSRRLS